MTRKPPDVLVVGGGIVGMLTARDLVKAGRTVTLIERDRVGHSASRAAGGMLSSMAPWDQPEALAAISALSLSMLAKLCVELENDTGIDCEYRRTGVLYLDCAQVEATRAYAEQTGERMRVLEPDEVVNLEPAAARVEGQSAYFPDLAQVRNPRLMDALAKDLRQRGVEILEDAGEVSLETDGTGVAVKTQAHGLLAAPDVVLAAGAWSGEVAKGLGLELPVKPVRGQIIWYQAPEAGIRHVLIRNMKYVVPRQEGVVLVGSTLEDVGFDDRPTPEARAMLEEMAAQIVPLLGRLPVQGHWAGLRPGSPGGIPFTGAVPGIPGLWLNTGHHCYGLKLAPGSAALLAALMTGAEPPIDPAPFDPGARMAL